MTYSGEKKTQASEEKHINYAIHDFTLKIVKKPTHASDYLIFLVSRLPFACFLCTDTFHHCDSDTQTISSLKTIIQYLP